MRDFVKTDQGYAGWRRRRGYDAPLGWTLCVLAHVPLSLAIASLVYRAPERPLPSYAPVCERE